MKFLDKCTNEVSTVISSFFTVYFANIQNEYTAFLYKDGQENIVDEHGVEPIDLVIDKLFAIETVSSRAQFLVNKPPERPSNSAMHPDADKRNSGDVVDMESYNK